MYNYLFCTILQRTAISSVSQNSVLLLHDMPNREIFFLINKMYNLFVTTVIDNIFCLINKNNTIFKDFLFHSSFYAKLIN